MQIPDNCTIVCDPNNGVFKTKGGGKTIKRTIDGTPPEG